jgi:hypothetical protein
MVGSPAGRAFPSQRRDLITDFAHCMNRSLTVTTSTVVGALPRSTKRAVSAGSAVMRAVPCTRSTSEAPGDEEDHGDTVVLEDVAQPVQPVVAAPVRDDERAVGLHRHEAGARPPRGVACTPRLPTVDSTQKGEAAIQARAVASTRGETFFAASSDVSP